jgi:hypothetical protein
MADTHMKKEKNEGVMSILPKIVDIGNTAIDHGPRDIPLMYELSYELFKFLPRLRWEISQDCFSHNLWLQKTKGGNQRCRSTMTQATKATKVH